MCGYKANTEKVTVRRPQFENSLGYMGRPIYKITERAKDEMGGGEGEGTESKLGCCSVEAVRGFWRQTL